MTGGSRSSASDISAAPSPPSSPPARSAFNVAAIFDRSPAVVGQTWQGIVVQDVAEMERMLAKDGLQHRRDLGSGRSRAGERQRVADLGIRAILNFAPMPLDLRGPVIVRNIDLAGEMAILTHRLSLE